MGTHITQDFHRTDEKEAPHSCASRKLGKTPGTLYIDAKVR